MAKMGFGYGSEWQLLRMLGRHQNYLNELIINKFNGDLTKRDSKTIEWLDFKFSASKDLELRGSDIFKTYNISKEIPKILSDTSWDCIGKYGDKLLLCEAKSHFGELPAKSQAKESSLIEYDRFLNDCLDFYQIDKAKYKEVWIKKSYQLGNRLVMNYYLNQVLHINSIIVYILFLNDWEYSYYSGHMKNNKTVKEQSKWKEKIDIKLKELGFQNELSENIKDSIIFVYPNCFGK